MKNKSIQHSRVPKRKYRQTKCDRKTNFSHSILFSFIQFQTYFSEYQGYGKRKFIQFNDAVISIGNETNCAILNRACFYYRKFREKEVKKPKW